MKVTMFSLLILTSCGFLLPNPSQAEWYVGGQVGYSKSNDLKNVEGTGSASGIDLSNLKLKNSVGYGVKLGYFLPEGFNWFGLEFETITSTPDIKNQDVTVRSGGVSTSLDDIDGSDLRIVAPSLNLLFRVPGYYVEPYAGGGIGPYWARLSDSTGKSSDVAPGFNGLGGVRFYVNEQWAFFTEYKYNYAKFKFNDSNLKATYSSHNFFGGVSFHF